MEIIDKINIIWNNVFIQEKTQESHLKKIIKAKIKNQ